jgi:hypothetical protein
MSAYFLQGNWRIASSSRNRVRKALDITKQKLAKLLDMRLSRLEMSQEEEEVFDQKEAVLKAEIASLTAYEKQNEVSEQQLQNTLRRFSLMSEILDTPKTALFRSGDRSCKRSVRT